MSTIIDQVSDRNGQELYRILQTYPVPDFVKNASHEDVCGRDLSPHQFADFTFRRFPTHTAAATIISAIFAHEKQADVRESVLERLDSAVDFWKVRDCVNALRTAITKAATYSEDDLSDADYAIVFKTPTGKERHCPMRNPVEVQKAASWLLAHRDEFDYVQRNDFATKVMQKAARFGADISQQRYELEKIAGLGRCAGSTAAKFIRQRIKAAGHTHRPNALQQEMEKLAQLCERDTTAVCNYTTLTKVAAFIDQYDRAHGIVREYGKAFERPEDVLFAVTEKIAAELDNELIGNTLTGNYYKKADLARIRVDDFADGLGQDFATEVSTANAWVDTEKLAAIVPTLPMGDAEQFDQIVSAAGISPFATKSASVGFSIDPKQWAQAVASHKARPGSLWARVPA
jgi:hypothetical protein